VTNKKTGIPEKAEGMVSEEYDNAFVTALAK